jgi:hypothetical protein
MNAYQNYYAHPLKGVVTLDACQLTLGELFAENEYGRAVVCDRAVHRGTGHTIVLFRRAARRSRARVIEDAPAILECVRAMEADAARRLSALEEAIRLPGAD